MEIIDNISNLFGDNLRQTITSGSKLRKQARLDIFDYIEWFYNAKRRHSYCDNMSPAQFEEMYYLNHQDL